MANGLPADLILPDAVTVLPGLPILAAQFRYLHECLNVATAELHAGHAIQQTWDDGVCEHAGATPLDGADPIPLCRWPIPVPSDRHTALLIMVRAEADNGVNDATLRFETVNGADDLEVVLDVDAIDDWTTVGQLDISGEWDEVQLFVSTDGAGTKAKIAQVIALYEPLSGPLAAVDVSGATPLGIGTSVAVDRPLPAGRGHQLVSTLNALYARPRVVQSWSDLDDSYSGVDASQVGMPAHGVMTITPHGPGRDFHAEFAIGTIVADQVADIRTTLTRRGATVAAEVADADSWLGLDIDATLLEDPLPDIQIRERGPVPTRTLVWDRGTEAGPNWVRSVGLWGP